MREHQIVITLKPEQFLEVQKQARAANAKSMGIFVRQKLLAALGIEGSLTAEQAESADLAPALAEIKRLHSELKLFVAESLSLYAELPVDEALAQQADAVVVATDAAEPLVESAEHSHFVQSEDELERAAERAFAISPRLGPIGQTGMVPIEQTVVSTSSEASPEPAPTTVADMLKSDLHSRREYHHHPHHLSATTFGAEDPLNKLLAEDDEETVDEQIQSGSQILAQYDEDDDDEEFDVPLSLSERRRLLEQQEQPQSISEEPAALDEDNAAADEEQNSDPIHEETSIPSASANTPQTSDQDQNLKPSTGRPLGYPPFSGSPPPKRRQV